MDRLFLVQDKTIYYHAYEDCCQQIAKGRYFNLVVRKLCMKLKMGVPSFLINPQVRRAKKILMTDTACHIGTVTACRKLFGRENVAIYYMNTIDEKNKKLMDFFEPQNIYTFDAGDAGKYGIRFLHTPFSTKLPSVTIGTTAPENEKKYEVLFLGRQKNRGDEIRKIFDLCKVKNLRAKFLVLDSEDPEMKLEKFLPYTEYIDLMKESRALLEINKEGQEGCSLRYMEALFYRKKLITNNKAICRDKYYKKENVFILGQDSEDTLSEFLSSDYRIPEKEAEILQNLDMENWLRSL